MIEIRLVIYLHLLFVLTGCNKTDIEGIKSDFSKEDLEYFAEIAFGSEFRNTKNPRLLFWRSDVKVQLNGKYTVEDSLEVLRVIQELNQLIDPIEVKIVENGGNVNMYFDYVSTFYSFPGYVPGNVGYFYIQRLVFFPKAYILIDCQQSIIRRKHIIREELTQVMGLRKDSWLYPESIFYQGWSATTEYAEIDRQLIPLLYNYNLPYGMKKSDFMQLINNIKRE